MNIVAECDIILIFPIPEIIIQFHRMIRFEIKDIAVDQVNQIVT